MGNINHIDIQFGDRLDCIPWFKVMQFDLVDVSLDLTQLPADWENNYCRNPANQQANTPYCFYQSSSSVIQRGFCHVPYCGNILLDLIMCAIYMSVFFLLYCQLPKILKFSSIVETYIVHRY